MREIQTMNEKYIQRGKVPDMAISQDNTGLFLYKALKLQKKDEVALINDTTGETITFGELVEKSLRLAVSFCHYKVVFNKVIAICSDNHVNYFNVVLGALYVGVPIAFINPNYTQYELQNALNLTKPDIIFCSTPYLDKFVKLKSENKFIRKIVTLDNKKSTGDSDSFVQFINRYSDEGLASMGFTTREVDVKNHIAFILFSSGTTGLPKGVMLSHLGVNTTVASVLDSSINVLKENEIALGVLPFFHIYGLHVALLSLYLGSKIVVLEKFEPELYLKSVQKYKIPRLTTVPPLIQFLLKSEVVNKYDLSCVKEIVCGAAPLGKKLEESIRKKFNLRIVRQGYGLTESGLAVSVPPIGDYSERPGSVGIPYPSQSYVIKDINTGENLGPNQEGEVCVKGNMIMIGYYQNEEATRNTFSKDGWLKTGDIGYYDKDGYLYIVDRIKELIKYKGFQVAPAELEQILITHPKIEDVGVVGLADDDAGELPVAFVVKQPNVSLTENEIHQHLANFVSRNKYLHGGVIFMDKIPRSPSGKILRKELKKMVVNMKSKL